MTDHFSETILPREKITNPVCPYCEKPAALREKMIKCCGLTAEAVLVIQAPPVEIIRDWNQGSGRLILDPNAIEPSFAVEKTPRAQSRSAWIGYLPHAGDIPHEVFRSFVEHQIPLPTCPRCRQWLEFRKDKSGTERPFCSEKTCRVFLSPSHFPQGSIGQWRSIYHNPFPLEKDEFRFYAKSFDSPHVEPHELRSMSEVEYYKHVAIFGATLGTSEAETNNSETDVIEPPSQQEDSDRVDGETDNKHSPQNPQSSPQEQENSPPRPSPQPEKKNSADEFIHTVVCEDPNPSTFVTRKALYSAYENWCKNTYSDCQSRHAFFRQIRELKEKAKDGRTRIDGKLVWGFRGIRIL